MLVTTAFQVTCEQHCSSVIGSGGLGEGFVGVPSTYQACDVLEGLPSGGDEGSFWALQSLLDPPVSIPYHPVDRSTR